MPSISELKAHFNYPLHAGKVDWHVHSTASDGLDSPTQLVRLAKKAGLQEFALTDHDTVGGVNEALAAGKKLGVRVIPGVELSVRDILRGRQAGIHLLALNINHRSPELAKWFSSREKERVKSAEKSVKILQSLGYSISMREVHQFAKGRMGRPAIARALVAHKENRALMKRSFKLSHEPASYDVFECLLRGGKPAYIQKSDVPNIHLAFRLVRKAGGLPVLAHPLLCESPQGTISLPFSKMREYAKEGCAGLEVYYTYPKQFPYPRSLRERWLKLARELNLAVTGGSDYHGKGALAIPYLKIGRIPYP